MKEVDLLQWGGLGCRGRSEDLHMICLRISQESQHIFSFKQNDLFVVFLKKKWRHADSAGLKTVSPGWFQQVMEDLRRQC